MYGYAQILKPKLQGISPFFIVSEVDRSIAFLLRQAWVRCEVSSAGGLGVFAIVGRDGVQIFMKSERGVAAVPNCERHPHLRWDAYVDVADPDALAAEFAGRGVSFSEGLKDTEDGLRGFEVRDPDGYVLFFGRPR